MADEPTPPEPATEPEPTPPEPAPSGPDRLPDDHPLVKAYQATKTQLADAKSKVKEFEDANKTEQEKLTEAKALAEKEATTKGSQLLRLEVALEKAPDGMPPKEVAKWAKRLTGSTRDELEADAAELFDGLKTGDTPRGKVPRQPTPDLKGGSDPTSPDVKPDAIKKVFDDFEL